MQNKMSPWLHQLPMQTINGNWRSILTCHYHADQLHEYWCCACGAPHLSACHTTISPNHTPPLTRPEHHYTINTTEHNLYLTNPNPPMQTLHNAKTKVHAHSHSIVLSWESQMCKKDRRHTNIVWNIMWSNRNVDMLTLPCPQKRKHTINVCMTHAHVKLVLCPILCQALGKLCIMPWDHNHVWSIAGFLFYLHTTQAQHKDSRQTISTDINKLDAF
jgi:hypothetical protein